MSKLEQKIAGLLIIILGFIITIIADGDGTALWITMPLGLFALFTKCDLSNYYENEREWRS